MLRFGVAPLFLSLLAACSTNPIVKTQTVTVHDPVLQPIPQALTKPVVAPVLPAGPITNAQLVDYILGLQAALNRANQQLHAIATLGDTP